MEVRDGSDGAGRYGDAAVAGNGGAEIDDKDRELARLKAKIQEKRKLLQEKKAQEASAQAEASAAPTPLRGERRSLTPPNDKDNVALTARNAERFSTQKKQIQSSSSSCLPPDLQERAKEMAAKVTALREACAAGDDSAYMTDSQPGQGNRRLAADDEIDVSFAGTCVHMCPDEELCRRDLDDDIQLLEKVDPGGLHPDNWTLRNTAVKRFRRSAADFKLNIPELVRPPKVLERVCGYLEEWVMVSKLCGMHALTFVHLMHVCSKPQFRLPLHTPSL